MILQRHLDKMVNNYGIVAWNDNSRTFVLLESGWLVFNRIKKRFSAHFDKLCFYRKKQFTNTYEKSTEQGQKWGWTGRSKSHSLEVSQ